VGRVSSIFLGSAASLLALASVSGCTSTHPAAASRTPTAHPTTVQSAAPLQWNPVTRQPLPQPGKILFQAADKSGSAQLTVIPKIDPGTLGIVALCSGPGKITVDMGKIASFTVGCGRNNPGVYNVVALGSARNSVPISVQATSGNTWALTLGWNSGLAKPPS
jgi:hypothetical protein